MGSLVPLGCCPRVSTCRDDACATASVGGPAPHRSVHASCVVRLAYVDNSVVSSRAGALLL